MRSLAALYRADFSANVSVVAEADGLVSVSL